MKINPSQWNITKIWLSLSFQTISLFFGKTKCILSKYKRMILWCIIKCWAYVFSLILAPLLANTQNVGITIVCIDDLFASILFLSDAGRGMSIIRQNIFHYLGMATITILSPCNLFEFFFFLSMFNTKKKERCLWWLSSSYIWWPFYPDNDDDDDDGPL